MAQQRPYFSFLTNHFSIRQFLTIFMTFLITGSIAILGVINYFEMKRQNDKLFQVQMVNGATMIDALINSIVQNNNNTILNKLITHEINLKAPASEADHQLTLKQNTYPNAFAFQVYNKDSGALIIKSQGAPDQAITSKPNTFTTLSLGHDNDQWYVFSMPSHLSGYNIVILVNAHLKYQAFWSLFSSSLWSLAILYLILLFATFFIVLSALRPLRKMKKVIEKKSPHYLKPIHLKRAPQEVTPLLEELNHLFERFNEALTREKRFASDAAHELKTPLAAIKTQAEVALNIDDIQQIKDKIRLIIERANHYFYIIEQLLTLSRVEFQHHLPDKQPIKLNKLIENQLSLLAMKALDKDIELSFTPNEDLPITNGNPALFEVMLRNVVDNAIRYTPEKGTVEVKTQQLRRKIKITITDTGIGVPADKCQRIFDRFYRQAGTKTSGSGLGLSIVQEIIRLHGGTAHAEPNHPNGLIISLELPVNT